MTQRKFGGHRPKARFGRPGLSEPPRASSGRKPVSHFKEIWCVCSIILPSGHARDGVIIGLAKDGARIRFRERAVLAPKVTLKASRLNLNVPAKLLWQEGFDAEIAF